MVFRWREGSDFLVLVHEPEELRLVALLRRVVARTVPLLDSEIPTEVDVILAALRLAGAFPPLGLC